MLIRPIHQFIFSESPQVKKVEKVALLCLEGAIVGLAATAAALFLTQTASVVISIGLVEAACCSGMVWVASFYCISSRQQSSAPREITIERGAPSVVIDEEEEDRVDLSSFDPESKKLIKTLQKEFPSIFYNSAFDRLFKNVPPREPQATSPLTAEWVKEIKTFFLQQKAPRRSLSSRNKALETLFTYPPSEDADKKLETAEAFFQLLPFFISVYQSKGSERKEVIPWLQRKAPEVLEFFNSMETFPFIALFKDELAPQFLALLEPFALFLEDDLPGKPVLHYLLHQMVFSLLPSLLKRDQKGLIKRVAYLASQKQDIDSLQDRLGDFESVAISPLIADCLETLVRRNNLGEQESKVDHEILEKTLSKWLPELESTIGSQPRKSRSPVDLQGFSNTFDAFFTDFSSRFLTLVDRDLVEAMKNQKGVPPLLKDIKTIRGWIAAQFKELFPEESLGTLIAKTYLISPSFFRSLGIDKQDPALFERWLGSLAALMREAGLNPVSLEEGARPYIKESLSLASKLSPEETRAMKNYPLQTFGLFLILYLRAIPHLKKAYPFLNRHFSTLLSLGQEFGLIDDLGNLEWGIKMLLKILRPLNFAITGRWPAKSPLIRVTIKTSFAFLKRLMPSDDFSIHEQFLMDHGENLLLFGILGVFGSKKKERTAYQHLDGMVTKFIQNLYSFDLQKGVRRA